MIAQPYQSAPTNARTRTLSFTQILFGLAFILSAVLTFLFSSFSPLGLVAIWPLTYAIILIGGALYSYHIRKKGVWGLAIVGQMLGILGIALFFIASL